MKGKLPDAAATDEAKDEVLRKVAALLALQRQRRTGSKRKLRLYYFKEGDKYFPIYLD